MRCKSFGLHSPISTMPPQIFSNFHKLMNRAGQQNYFSIFLVSENQLSDKIKTHLLNTIASNPAKMPAEIMPEPPPSCGGYDHQTHHLC